MDSFGSFGPFASRREKQYVTPNCSLPPVLLFFGRRGKRREVKSYFALLSSPLLSCSWRSSPPFGFYFFKKKITRASFFKPNERNGIRSNLLSPLGRSEQAYFFFASLVLSSPVRSSLIPFSPCCSRRAAKQREKAFPSGGRKGQGFCLLLLLSLFSLLLSSLSRSEGEK